jgi:chromosome segregation ATPase
MQDQFGFFLKAEEYEQKLSAQAAEFNHLVKQLAFCEMELEASRVKRAQLDAALKEKEAETLNREEVLTAKEQELNQLREKVDEVTEALGEKTVELEKIAENNKEIEK